MTADTLTDTVASPSHAPTYPAHWLMARLGEIGNIIGGSTPSTKVAEYWNGRIPWLTPNEVTRAADLKIADTERHITEQGLANCSANLLPAGTVMMTSRATIGEVAINTVPMATNQGFVNVICDSATIFNEFLAYWLMLHKSALVSRASGSTFLEISKSSFRSIPIMLPPLAEQRAIARILRTAQDAIAARRSQVTLERERKAALMQRLFTHGVRGGPTKQTEIGEMPQSWQVVRLQDFLREPLKNGVSTPEAPSGEGIRTLTLSAVTKDDFSIGNTKVTTAEPMRVRDLWLQSGDLFIERANTQELVGSAAMYYGPDRFAIYPDLLIRVRTRSGELDAGYLLEYLRTGWCRSYFRRNARGTAGNMPKIDHETVRRLPLPLPSYDEQSEIAFLARSSDTHIAAVERDLALHGELFRALLEELMSGRLSALPLVEGKEVTTDI